MVETWWLDFIDRLQERVPRYDWPAPDAEYWQMFKRKLIKHGVAEPEADAASDLLAENPPAHLDRVVEAFLARVREVWSASNLAPGAMGRDAARLASRGCPECAGGGLTARRFAARDPDAVSGGFVQVAFCCVCPHGQWFAAQGTAETPAPPNLAAHVDLLRATEVHPSWPERFAPPRPFQAIRLENGRVIELGECLDPDRFVSHLQGWREHAGRAPDRPASALAEALRVPPMANVTYDASGRKVTIGPDGCTEAPSEGLDTESPPF